MVAEFIGDIPHGHLAAEHRGGVNHRPQPHGRRDAEWQNRQRVIVANGHDVRTLGIDRAMDKALEVRGSGIVQSRSIERKLHLVRLLDQLRRPRPGQQEAVRSLRVARADMPERIQDAFVRQNPVRFDQVPTDVFKPLHSHCRIQSWLDCIMQHQPDLAALDVGPAILIGHPWPHP